MFLSSVLALLKINAQTPQNLQFWYSSSVTKRYTTISIKKLYLFYSCPDHFIDMALRKSCWQIILFAKVFDSMHRKCSYVWVIFLQNFTYFGVREILLQQLTKKIEVNFIHSLYIHFNPRPTTVNALNNLIQCYSNFTSILAPTYQNKL